MSRIRELEAIRRIWVVLILAFHATQASFFLGWSRVDLFFVLSGYLAPRKLLEPSRGRSSLENDLTRRLLRHALGILSQQARSARVSLDLV